MASFVNPHDIVLFPTWVLRSPVKPSPLDPPHVPPAPTAEEDLRTKPAAQIAFREAYYSGYGPAAAIQQVYDRNAQRYRDLYYRLHAEVDAPIDRVRRAVTERIGGCGAGAHLRPRRPARRTRRPAPEVVQPLRRGDPGAVHHRPHRPAGHRSRGWSTPRHRTSIWCRRCSARPESTSTAVADSLRESFSEVHPLPGRDLMPVVDGAPADDRPRGLPDDPRQHSRRRLRRLRPWPPATADVESTCAASDPDSGTHRRQLRGPGGPSRRADGPGGAGHRWKLVRSFDDPSTWTEPGVRHLAANGLGGEVYRTSPLDDQWELYDLTDDPDEAVNRWDDPAPARTARRTCGCGSSTAGPSRFPNATTRGRTPRGGRTEGGQGAVEFARQPP